jgi:hypothetical protein
MPTSLRTSKTMRIKMAALMALAMILFAWIGEAQSKKASVVVWIDDDFKNISEPKSREGGYYSAFFNSEAGERWKRALDVPHHVRFAVGAPKQAANVNALDEVPDSSWFTNRHALRPMTVQQLVQGPNRGDPPDFTSGTIKKAKMDGVTPGFLVTDSKGRDYLIKFDHKDYPELQSGAEVISTKILFAAGYNVPENYISYLDPAKLVITEGMEVGDGKSKHHFTREELTKMLENVARGADGRYRALASEILEGTPKGPFSYVGVRKDDPNDLIPHEHRRELRGLRVIASWINHWDVKEGNTLDTYVEEGGRKYLRHHLIDFGSSLGGGKTPLEYFHGREYAFDAGTMMKELFTLGFYVTPDEKKASLVYPQVGIFSAEDFDPGDWIPSFHVMPFDNMTREDAYWATRIILSFKDDEILQIVKTGQYTDPKVTDYVFRVLLERRRLIAKHWLSDVNPIGKFAVAATSDGFELRFDDFMIADDLAGPSEYRYEMISPGAKANGAGLPQKKLTAVPRIPLGHAIAGETRVRIWSTRDASAKPVTVYVNTRPDGMTGLLRIERS